MPSLVETVTSLLKQGDTLSRLGELLDADANRMSALVDLATPPVVAGLADRAAEPGGAEMVNGLLDSVDESIVDHRLAFLEPAHSPLADQLAAEVLGTRLAGLTDALGQRTGVGEHSITRLLPGLLVLAMGVLQRRRTVSGLDAAGVAALLSNEKSALIAALDDPDDHRNVPAMAAPVATAATGSTVPPTAARAAVPVDATGGGAPSTATSDPSPEQPTSAPVGPDDRPPASADPNSDRPSGKVDGAGSAWLWLLGAGLIGVVFLAWILSLLAGGGSSIDEPGDVDLPAVIEDSTDAEDTDGGSTGTATSGDEEAAVGEGAGATEDPDEADDGQAADDQAGDAVDADPSDDTEEPATINEELDLDPVTFEVRSATITDAGRAVLDEAAAYLASHPDVTVEIAGHTDSDGESAENITLSQDRADVVKAYLEEQGIDGSRLVPVGYGETEPVASNETEAGKARNRRIEFIIQ